MSSISCQILAAVFSLCCSLVTCCTPVKPCITLLISAVTDVDNSQTSLGVFENPLPLVNPLVILTLRIKTCSIIRSDDSPAQNRSERLTMCRPFLKANNKSGCSSWRYSLRDLMYKLCPEAAKYGSFVLQLLRCSSQFSVLYTFVKECRIWIISRYCNQSLAVRDSLRSLSLFCRDSENLSISYVVGRNIFKISIGVVFLRINGIIVLSFMFFFRPSLHRFYLVFLTN